MLLVQTILFELPSTVLISKISESLNNLVLDIFLTLSPASHINIIDHYRIILIKRAGCGDEVEGALLCAQKC